ncbi:phosphodiesterase [Amylibacter sp. SFDW26]|uniref:metallophosphoesterase n=1 Tax=Amylibacter sp. SFDW26 TaxID=2652722 RepID=UPI00126162A9|nr:metallophosphoesterase [Amylibacter sp. SFDW26]KAB7613442.1 phosphodiesterase [Amylibacter sp. SFDW26]
MKKLLAFTDLHIRASNIIGLDPVERFKEGLAHSLAHHSDAEGIVLMGDLTHSGTVSEYELLKSLLMGIELPIIFMMGNHDRRDAFMQVFPDAVLDGNGFVQSKRNIGGWHFITLDSLDGPPYPDKQHSGRLCDDRLTWLSDALRQASDKPVVLFIHHPLGDVGFPGMDDIKLTNADDVLALINHHQMPVHVVAGHVHRTISGMWSGVPYTIFKSPCHQQPLDFTIANSSLAVDEPGAYGLLIFDEGNLIIHSEDFGIAQRDIPPDPDVDG